MTTCGPTQLSDAELIAAVEHLAHSERNATCGLVAHLAEFDERKLHLGAGFSSLFAYCCEVLHLSEHATGNRIAAARAARRFPIVLEMLACGSVNLTTVRLLSPHLDKANHRDLLAAAAHRNKRDVEELIAHRFPLPEIVSSVRKLPARRSVATTFRETTDPPGPGPAVVPTPSDPLSVAPLVAQGAVSTAGRDCPPRGHGPPLLPPGSPPRRALIAALAPDRYEIRFTASYDTRDKLRRAQELLRHTIPSGDPAQIFDRALTALLDDLARRKVAALRPCARARPKRAIAPDSRHVPADVKRAVWLRDGGQCAFVAKGGRRCGERGFLEFHHLRPYGVGGEATRDNIALHCRAHNAYEADLFMARAVETKPGSSASGDRPKPAGGLRGRSTPRILSSSPDSLGRLASGLRGEGEARGGVLRADVPPRIA